MKMPRAAGPRQSPCTRVRRGGGKYHRVQSIDQMDHNRGDGEGWEVLAVDVEPDEAEGPLLQGIEAPPYRAVTAPLS